MRQIDVSFPTWVFLPEDQMRPRRLSDALPAGARPAKIRGWRRLYWRFGVDMATWWGPRDHDKPNYGMTPASVVLEAMRYDADYDHADYRVVFEPPKFKPKLKDKGKAGDGNSNSNSNVDAAAESVDLKTWYEDADGTYQQRPIGRVERTYDGLTIWDGAYKADISSEPDIDTTYVVDGYAVPVTSPEDLHACIPAKHHPEAFWRYWDGWSGPLKAQFEFVDEEAGVCKGIVYNGRAQLFEGIITGWPFQYNNQFLVGTRYENLSKEEKEAFFDSFGNVW